MKDKYGLINMILSIRWMFLIGVLFIIAEAQTWIVTIGFQRRLIDEVLLNGHYSQLFHVVSYIAAGLIMYALLFTIAPMLLNYMVSQTRVRLSNALISYLHQIPTRKLQQERTATFVHYFTQDVDTASQLIGNSIPRLIQQVVSTVTLMVIVGSASHFLLLCVMIFSLIYIFIGKHFSVKVKEQFTDMRQKRSNLLVHLEEGISSTREVIAFNRMTWEKTIYERLFGAFYKSSLKEAWGNCIRLLSTEPIKWTTNLIFIGYGGYLVINNELSLGLFIVTYQLASQLMDTQLELFTSIMGISGQMASFERLASVVNGEVQNNCSSRILGEIRQIQFEKVGFTYEDDARLVLDDITLHITAGSKTAIVGSSGSGKSTISLLLMRFYEPRSGKIMINGIELEQLNRSSWSERIRIVVQEPYFFPDSVRTNLLMGSIHTPEQLEAACRAALIHDFITTLPYGYDSIIGERGITLSGGQRQRLAIARAILHQSDILILDEATSALDYETERVIQHNIDAVRNGKTTIVIAHRLSTVKNADSMIVLHQGKVVEQGTHEELMDNGTFYPKLVEAQNHEITGAAG